MKKVLKKYPELKIQRILEKVTSASDYGTPQFEKKCRNSLAQEKCRKKKGMSRVREGNRIHKKEQRSRNSTKAKKDSRVSMARFRSKQKLIAKFKNKASDASTSKV